MSENSAAFAALASAAISAIDSFFMRFSRGVLNVRFGKPILVQKPAF
jgi:hypothetical protein